MRSRKITKRRGRMPQPVKTYKTTVSGTWYDKQRRMAQEHEMYLTATRPGRVGTVRKRLADRGIKYFQQYVYRETGQWIPRRKIKARFEREKPAIKQEPHITIEALRLEHKGRRTRARRLPSRVIQYGKRRRRRTGR